MPISFKRRPFLRVLLLSLFAADPAKRLRIGI
ncbi:ABC transporter substrate-binding protein, partial [Pseudomonas syringae pv. actinidiae]|nr:ABC transporter substrate-binding protein [Pseudomonas syringae pv. actinidiae]